MERKFKQWWSSIPKKYQQNEQSPLILTEPTDLLMIITNAIGNPGPGLGQAQICGGAKPKKWMVFVGNQNKKVIKPLE